MFGAVVGNPFDRLMVLQQSSKESLNASAQRMFQAPFKGALMGCLRGGAMNTGMFMGFETGKEWYGLIGGCLLGGLGASILALPFDNIKVKVQSWTQNTNMLQVFKYTVDSEGIFGLWTGLGYFYTRVAPHAMIVMNI